MNNTKEFNVKFLEFRDHYWKTDCIFELHPEIADFIRDNKLGSKEVLDYYLNADNHFVLSVESKDTEYMMSFIKEIERVGNGEDTKYVINRLITDNGKFIQFYKVRELLEKDFGLTDRIIQRKVMIFFSELAILKYNLW